MSHPYREFEGTRLWREIETALGELERNHDISLTTTREHVVGYLCKRLVAKDRMDAWCDDAAICVIAVGAHGDPLDLAEHEVENLIAKLQGCLREARGEAPAQ
jgi:hypothetical protein